MTASKRVRRSGTKLLHGTSGPSSHCPAPGGSEARATFAPMSAMPKAGAGEPDDVDASRRTSLAAERTWLAWWRTGLGASAVAIGVGRILPGLAGGANWPLQLLGLGYAALAVAVLVIGGVRQNRVAAALRSG